MLAAVLIGAATPRIFPLLLARRSGCGGDAKMIVMAWVSFAVILSTHALRAAHRSSYCAWRAAHGGASSRLAMGFACASSGALGVALAVPWADTLFAAGAALYLIGNRRARINEAREDFLDAVLPPGPPR